MVREYRSNPTTSAHGKTYWDTLKNAIGLPARKPCPERNWTASGKHRQRDSNTYTECYCFYIQVRFGVNLHLSHRSEIMHMVKKTSSSLTLNLYLVVFKDPQPGADLLYQLHFAKPLHTDSVHSGVPQPGQGVEVSSIIWSHEVQHLTHTHTDALWFCALTIQFKMK